MAGVAPKFSPVDLLRALLLFSNQPQSRQSVVKSLGLGEGSVRTVLDYLKEDSLLVSDRPGHRLSEAGQALQSAIRVHLEGPIDILLEGYDFPWRRAVLVRSPPMKLDPVRLRDIGLKWGAEAAIILIRKSGRWTLPGAQSSIDTASLDLAFQAKDGDVAIVCFAHSRLAASTSALAIALNLHPALKDIVAKQFTRGMDSLPLP